jgi:hypothetical protein
LWFRIPRLSKDDKNGLAHENKTIFVAIPRTVANKRASHQNVLMKFLSDQKFDGISLLIPSAASFIVVSFGTTKYRDHATAKLWKKRFISDGVEISLQTRPFRLAQIPGAVWTVNTFLETTQEVTDAVIALFQSDNVKATKA